MAITNTGYDGSVGETEWAKLAPNLGAMYTVEGAADFQPSIGSGTRQVTIAVGAAVGWGVRSVLDAEVTKTIATVSSGSRWDLIVLHRDWSGTGGTTTIEVITGTASLVLPTRDTNPGVLDDQPLALVRVAAGQSQVQEIIDLRAWTADGGTFAKNKLVLSFLNRLGSQIFIDKQLWFRVLNGIGTAEWQPMNIRDTLAYGVLAGSTPPSDALIVEKTGVTGAVATNANGDASIVFPGGAFPNGVLFADVRRYSYAALGGTYEVLATSQSLSQLNFRVYRSDGLPLAGIGYLQYTFRVIGW